MVPGVNVQSQSPQRWPFLSHHRRFTARSSVLSIAVVHRPVRVQNPAYLAAHRLLNDADPLVPEADELHARFELLGFQKVVQGDHLCGFEADPDIHAPDFSPTQRMASRACFQGEDVFPVFAESSSSAIVSPNLAAAACASY